MFKKIIRLFENKCPVCHEKLYSQNETACVTKACPEGHYTEESYCSLGVTVIYDELT